MRAIAAVNAGRSVSRPKRRPMRYETCPEVPRAKLSATFAADPVRSAYRSREAGKETNGYLQAEPPRP